MDTDLETQMLARIRRHMLTSLAGVGVGIIGIVGFGLLHGALHLPGWARVFFAFPLALIPTVGLWSTFKNLRCPHCEGQVGFQVSANASIFGAMARKTCRHCGAKVFGDGFTRRFGRFVVIMVVAAFAMLIVAGTMGFVAQTARNHANAVPSASTR